MKVKKNDEYIIQEELVGTRIDKAIPILDKEISRMTARKTNRRRKYNSKSEKK